MKIMKTSLIALLFVFAASPASADPLTCDLGGYKATDGLTAAVSDNTLTVTWAGDNDSEVRVRFALERATPVMKEIALRRKGGQWATLVSNVSPEFHVVSGMRRMTQQQLRPDSIQALGGTVSAKVMALYDKDDPSWIDEAVREGQVKASDVERWKWEAFWDAPLYVEGSGVRPPSHATSIPPMNGIFGQKGLPRTPDEVVRATAAFQVQGCSVKTNGARLEIAFPGVTAGVFTDGRSAVRHVQGFEPDSPGADRQDRSALRGLQVRRRT